MKLFVSGATKKEEDMDQVDKTESENQDAEDRRQEMFEVLVQETIL